MRFLCFKWHLPGLVCGVQTPSLCLLCPPGWPLDTPCPWWPVSLTSGSSIDPHCPADSPGPCLLFELKLFLDTLCRKAITQMVLGQQKGNLSRTGSPEHSHPSPGGIWPFETCEHSYPPAHKTLPPTKHGGSSLSSEPGAGLTWCQTPARSREPARQAASPASHAPSIYGAPSVCWVLAP